MDELVIGIDLGTTNTCAAYFINGRVKVLENKEGGRITPSYVFFTDANTTLVGQYAKRMADSKPEYGVYEVKRLVGRSFDDPHVQNNLPYLPYKVKDVANEPIILVENKNKINKKKPEEICALILKKVKEDVESKLGETITKAVITVPAYFNIKQREATLEAARSIGLTVLKLLNEPTASALTYFFEKSSTSLNDYSLVYDLGGGTLDVAILQRNREKIEIINVDGDTHLGGHDFDNLMVESVCEFLEKNHQYNAKANTRDMLRLHYECEEAKKCLTFTDSVTINLVAFPKTHEPVEVSFTRTQFEKIIKHLVKKSIDIVKRSLENAKLQKNDIKEVILAGGSTRIPLVQAMVAEFFDGVPLTRFVNPDECVAEGAALQAAMLSQHPDQVIKKIKITDVTPLSIGLSNFVNSMTFLIKSNTAIPTSAMNERVSVYDKQDAMSFNIYEGERTDCRKNYHLGTLAITGLTLAPPGACRVNVSMYIDHNGILTVKATEVVSNKTKNLKINYTRGSKSEDEVRSVLLDAARNQKEDELFQQFADVKADLLKYCVKVKYNLQEKNLISTYQNVYDQCDEIQSRANRMEVAEMADVLELKSDLMVLCAPLVKRHRFEFMI